MAPILREYRPADFEALFQLDQSCYAPGIAYSRRMLRQYLALPGTICLVAEAEPEANAAAPANKITGFILAEFDADEAHIITLDVSPVARREKIGTQLYITMEEDLARRGVREIFLETATDNAAGIAFWRRHGYRTAGVIRNYYLRGTHAYAMSKQIHADSAAQAAPEP
jgi:[ribosomal protein S18]-alanine N-acetyltransferase